MPAKRDSRSGEKTSRSLGIAAYSSDPSQQRTDFDWTFLSQMDSSGTHSEQYKPILQIRELLKQYIMFEWMRACRGADKTDEQTWLQAQITRLQKLIYTDVQWLRRWMFTEENGNMRCPDIEFRLFTETPQDELIAIKAREYSDTVTRWFATRFVLVYHRFIDQHIHKVGSRSSSLALQLIRNRLRTNCIWSTTLCTQDEATTGSWRH